jgi:septum site-determining protein MinC
VSEFVHGGQFTVMVVRVDDPVDPAFESRLAEHVGRNPRFFANAPVVLDLKGCNGLATADAFHKLRALFKRQYLIPIGIQNGNATQVRAAANADLAAFPEGAPAGGAESPAAVDPIAAMPVAAGRTRVVTQPVRSGTQIYAQGGDLLVLAAVSPGAEVIADGHVHIYGALRGRAIAGASGDREARIFVGKLEAELLSVAGHYLVSEAIGAEFRGKSVQVALVDDTLTVTRT